MCDTKEKREINENKNKNEYNKWKITLKMKSSGESDCVKGRE